MLLNPVTNFLPHTGAAREFVFSRPAEGVPDVVDCRIPQRVFSGITPKVPGSNVRLRDGAAPCGALPKGFLSGSVPIKLVPPKTGHCSLSPFCRCGDYILEGRLEPGACFQTPLDPLLNPRRRARIWLPSPSSRLSV